MLGCRFPLTQLVNIQQASFSHACGSRAVTKFCRAIGSAGAKRMHPPKNAAKKCAQDGVLGRMAYASGGADCDH